MVRTALVLVAALLAAAVSPLPSSAQAAVTGDACGQMLEAVRAANDPNAVVLHLHAARPVLGGVVHAYSATHVWSGTIVTAARSVTAEGLDDQSVELRATAPILGVELAPSWATCTLHAAVRLPTIRDRSAAASPAIALSDGGGAEALSCARPYAVAGVIHSSAPDTPLLAHQQGIGGVVIVLVELDATGAVQNAVIAHSPSAVLNASALLAARQSVYRAPVFRCAPVAGPYEFAVDYMK